jgi:hypothetical protein
VVDGGKLSWYWMEGGGGGCWSRWAVVLNGGDGG